MSSIFPTTLAAAIVIGGSALLAPQPARAQEAERGQANTGAQQPGWERQADRYRSSGNGSDGMGATVERHLREGFERGYRAGREEERRRRAAANGGGEERASRGSSGADREAERYLVIPDILPDTPRYRGMQDFALVPDRTASMDWLLTAAQSLREAVQAMAQQPPSERRNRAMDRAREALLETQQAMVQLPADLRTR
jgi:hypothetical protein